MSVGIARIAVIGAGAWGAALANVLVQNGRDVVLIARDPAKAAAMQATRQTPYLPGVTLDRHIAVTAELKCVAQAQAILAVVPAQALRAALGGLDVGSGFPVIACAKGIERSTGKFMTDVIAECLPQAAPAILSGPSFAADVARGLPTAVTLAAATEALAGSLAEALGCMTFRVYHTTDIRGVEIGGAAKNVLAIAAGVVAGRGLGASAAAALITRGFAELIRFGRASGARPETLMGLSGLGDVILTCSSEQSRNFSLGRALGRAKDDAQAAGFDKLAEGALTASVLVELARKRGVEMPIAEAVAAILDGRIDVDRAIEKLLARPVRAEE